MVGRESGHCPLLTREGILKGKSGSRVETDDPSAPHSKSSLTGTFSKEQEGLRTQRDPAKPIGISKVPCQVEKESWGQERQSSNPMWTTILVYNLLRKKDHASVIVGHIYN